MDFLRLQMPQGEPSITLTAGPVARHHIHPPSFTLSFTPSLTSLSSMICKYTYLTFLPWLSDTSRTRCLDIIASREVISLEPIDQPLLSDPSCPHLPFVWWLGWPRRCWRYILGIHLPNVILSLTVYQIGANRKLGVKRSEGNGWD